MSRKPFIAGNWKMHKNAGQTEELLSELIAKIPAQTTAQVIVAPTFVNLAAAVAKVKNTTIGVSAQNVHQAEGGAFTGEISADMLTSIGVNTVILGHSERRAIFHETDALIANKVDTALKHDMTVIFCFGEELKDRQTGNHFNIVENQLRDGLFHIAKESWSKVVLAYEPVWAIGTGLNASAEQAEEMHSEIRFLLAENYSNKISEQISIIYGGSCNTSNAAQLFACPNVDGALVGGASLDKFSFIELAASLK